MFSYGVPFVAFSFVGIETTVIAAFEARTSRSMALPSRTVHFFIFVFYLLCTLGIALTVPWTDSHLSLTAPVSSLPDPKTNSPVIVAIHEYYTGSPLSGFFNGCLIMSVLSAANTSLYVASRTLYGMLYDLNGSNFATRRLKAISVIWRSTGVPTRALILTFLFFYWLPWLNLKKSFTVGDVSHVAP
jgi:yeast amino acid transporter